jgi:LmbE family N-acetylglucosaminyl deacetylase
MGQVRRKEAIAAMKSLGIAEDDLIFLGYPDFGTFAMFNDYWQGKAPYKSMLTRISAVPYKENFSYGVLYKPEHILNDIKLTLMQYKPTKIFVSHPADVNADHKALYLYLQVALLDLTGDIGDPKVYPYLIHHVGWPLPRHYHPDKSLSPPDDFAASEINWLEYRLSPEEIEKKHQAVLYYRSQTESSAFYLLAFARQNELFGDYPAIELERQVSLKEKAVSFFGFSHLFSDIGLAGLQDTENFILEKNGVSYAEADHHLLLRIEKPQNMKYRFGATVYLFGYRGKTPFREMPKIRILNLYDRVRVFDGRKAMDEEGIAVEIAPGTLTLKIPLQLLGNPEIVFASVKTQGGKVSSDASAFRMIKISPLVLPQASNKAQAR